MSKYQMSISGDIGLSEFSSIDDYVALVDSSDILTVIFENVDNAKIDTLYKIFEKNDLNIKKTRGNIDGKYIIKAAKIKK